MTVFDTPVIRPFFRLISQLCLKLMGWRVVGQLPDQPKYVIIGAFHTSNWDFVIGLSAAFMLRIKAYWVGKDNLFRAPFDIFFRWTGGIPINRSISQNLVERITEIYRARERLVVALAPEGTRKKVKHWKTGFYHIAVGAGVPIVLGFIDYRKKLCGLGPVLVPTGDIAADMEKIRRFYSGVTAKYPDMMGLPSIEPQKYRKTGS
ncbi:MAG TPA: lysophospholipid acyltransferase family protein [Deltaproteobacteria bacterium]|nr:lysophospholipid acyltransferase family protein [Deltaproteobacteria bacterium]